MKQMPFGGQLSPALSNLESVINNGSFYQHGVGVTSGEGRRFIGWTTKRHWLLGPEEMETTG